MSTIRETVARAIANFDPHMRTDSVSKRQATAAITAFLEAAAEQGWHLQPDEATEAMTVAGCWHENMGDMAGRYRAMNQAAPEFEWRDK